mgnify:FL=1
MHGFSGNALINSSEKEPYPIFEQFSIYDKSADSKCVTSKEIALCLDSVRF